MECNVFGLLSLLDLQFAWDVSSINFSSLLVHEHLSGNFWLTLCEGDSLIVVLLQTLTASSTANKTMWHEWYRTWSWLCEKEGSTEGSCCFYHPPKNCPGKNAEREGVCFISWTGALSNLAWIVKIMHSIFKRFLSVL